MYSHFVSDALPIKQRSSGRRVDRSSEGQSATGYDVLMLLSDAFGGFGGIAKFNRDFLTALCANPIIERVVAVPRVASQESEPLPPKLTYATSALGGKAHFMREVTLAPRATLCKREELQPNHHLRTY